jgi:hypothetical protein
MVTAVGSFGGVGTGTQLVSMSRFTDVTEVGITPGD